MKKKRRVIKKINTNPKNNSTRFQRIILIILDSVGCGVQEDYKKYHKQQCNTLLSIYKHNKKFKLPNLEKLGLKKILFNKNINNNYCAGKIRLQTVGNDTLAGVWEMMGVAFKKRFRSLECGLNNNILCKIKKQLGVNFVGNEYIQGLTAINKFYHLHQQTKAPILYFDKDGVAQIAAHEKIIKPQQLNKLGKKLLPILEKYNIARIITRPFTGTIGNFTRNVGAYYSFVGKKFLPFSILNNLKKHNINVLTTEHIKKLLGNPSWIKTIKNELDNLTLLKNINKVIKEDKRSQVMIFCLRDFDTTGHYKDIFGYGLKLIEIDNYLPIILKNLNKKDLMIITADHGCDPSYNIRGHTREFVPLLIYSKQNHKKIWLGTRNTHSDIGQTINFNFSFPLVKKGTPIKEILF